MTELQLPPDAPFNDIDQTKNQNEFQVELIEDLRWLLDASSRHSSVDTFAKKLFLAQKYSALEKLKRALSIFFMFEQLRRPPDSRYDTFFASILNSRFKFPDNIKIVSWNYDSQFEISYSEYSEQPFISYNQQPLNTRIKDFEERLFDPSGFSLFKLNGTTGFFKRTHEHFMFVDKIRKFDIETIHDVIHHYALVKNDKSFKSSLSFGWESSNSNTDIVDEAKNAVADSNVLVVIGYSFPYFNREVDRKIINGMQRLQKVYIQSPEAEIIKQRFTAIRNNLSADQFELSDDRGQFLLPHEL